MTSPRLTAITLEGFRGFTREQRLSLDADAILVRGDNGSGKTSLIDGFLWLFCGELKYLVDRLRERKLRQDEDVVRSRFTDVAARVTLELQSDGCRYAFARAGAQKHAPLEATRDGRPVGAPEQALAELFGHRTPESLRTAMLTWGLLRQDAVRATLDTAGGALHERLAGIVGLEQVSGFAAATTRAANGLQAQRTAQGQAFAALGRRRDEAVERHRAATADLSAVVAAGEPVAVQVARLTGLLPVGFVLRVREDADVSTVEDLGRVCGALAEALRALSVRRAAVDELERAAPVSVHRAEADVASARTRLTQAGTSAPASARLAQAALDTLEGDHCPVCGQTIDHDELVAHLQESLSHAAVLFSAAQEASDTLAQAGSRLSEAREQERRLAQLRAEMRAAENHAHAAVAAVEGLTYEGALPADHADVEIAAQGLERFVSALRDVWRAVMQAGGAHLERLAGERDALAAEVASAAGALEELEGRYARSKNLERGAHDAAEAIVAEALERLQPSFAEVFDRLNPNPAFTELRARQDVLRNVNQVVPVVHDLQRGLDANPLLVFSEGQLNVVALSYFLGMALNARDALLPFLILDDPLQALDTIAVLGFGDLCRRIRDERQLVISTHDRRFADILGRKLAPRELGATTIVHEFEGWTREGPSVKTTPLEPAQVVPLLRQVS